MHICVSVYPLSDPRHLKFEKVKVKWKELDPMRETETQKRVAYEVSVSKLECMDEPV